MRRRLPGGLCVPHVDDTMIPRHCSNDPIMIQCPDDPMCQSMLTSSIIDASNTQAHCSPPRLRRRLAVRYDAPKIRASSSASVSRGSMAAVVLRMFAFSIRLSQKTDSSASSDTIPILDVNSACDRARSVFGSPSTNLSERSAKASARACSSSAWLTPLGGATGMPQVQCSNDRNCSNDPMMIQCPNDPMSQ